MLLIVAHHYDQEAVWLYNSIRKHHKILVKLLIPETLGLDYHISLNLSNTDAAKSSVKWFDTGEEVFNTDVSWLINRLSYIDPVIWNRSASSEKLYATNELNAFFAAFIHSFSCAITNSIQNGSLYGEIQFLSLWISHFKKIGINPHPALLKNNAFPDKEDTNPTELFRFLCFKNSLYQPATQTSQPDLTRLLTLDTTLNPFDTLEFIFKQKKKSRKFQFINASATPCFSAYGNSFIETFINQFKTTNHDTAIWNTERKPDGTFDRCLHPIEHPALCF